MEHFASPLAVGTSDKRSVNIVEPLAIEEVVNCKSHCMTDAKNCSESIGTETQVSNLAEEFEAVTLWLQRIFVGICIAENGNVLCLQFHLLSATHRLDGLSVNRQSSTSVNTSQFLFQFGIYIQHHLKVIYSRAIVQCDETYVLANTLSPNPTHYGCFFSKFRGVQHFTNLSSLHIR